MPLRPKTRIKNPPALEEHGLLAVCSNAYQYRHGPELVSTVYPCRHILDTEPPKGRTYKSFVRVHSSGAWTISNPCRRWDICKVKTHTSTYIVADCLILSVRACKGTKGKAPKSSRPQRHTISPRKMPLTAYQLRYQVLFDRYEAQRLLVLLMFPDLKGTNKHTEAASRTF